MAPTILLIAGYVWFTRRQMGGLTGGGGGGRGIFNVGKAQVGTLHQSMLSCICSRCLSADVAQLCNAACS